MSRVKLDHVCKDYYSGGNTVQAVIDLNLTVEDGELLSLLGPSGCGKSSTMRMIAGLEHITRGRILFDEQTVNEIEPANRNTALAFESYALYQHLPIRENIGFCLKARKVPQSEIRRRVEQIAELVGITDILDVKPVGLSGGQQQLVSLARALVRKPSVTLLDEPISHLDTKARLQMSFKIRKIHSETGLTMIYVTHNQEEAMAIADQVAVMSFGKLQQVGPRNEILNKPRNLFVATFVGEPPMNLFECSVKGPDADHLTAQSLTTDITFKIEPRLAHKITSLNLNRLIVGIRPQNFHESRTGSVGDKISGVVHLHEYLGESSSLRVKVGEETLTAVFTRELSLKKGNKVEFWYDPAEMLFFNPENEEAIFV